MDLIEARRYHLRQLEARGRADNTLKLYGRYEGVFLELLEARQLEPTLGLLNPSMVEDCLIWMAENPRGRRGGQAARYVCAEILKVWSRFLARRHITATDQLVTFDRPRLRKIRRVPFTQIEARRILVAALAGRNPIRDRAILLLLSDTGCRVGELCGLSLADVLDGDGKLTGRVVFRLTKNGHPREVVYRVPGIRDGGPCQAALRQWLRVREAEPGVDSVFTTTDGWPLDTRRVREMHAQHGQSAGVTDCFPHRWRHTNLSEAFGEGVQPEALRDRAGHLSPDVLRDYITIGDRTRDQVAARTALSLKWQL